MYVEYACIISKYLANFCLDIQTAIYEEVMAAGMNAEILRQMHPFNGPGKPSDIAKIAVVLASDDASWVTGASWLVDGGYTAR